MLELQDIQQGFAWRPLLGTNILQIYPPTREPKWLRDGPFLVIRIKKSEWRYYDPNYILNNNQWSYVGCNCSDLPGKQVWNWIKQAYEYLKGYKAPLIQRQSFTTTGQIYNDEEIKNEVIKVVEIESVYKTGKRPICLNILVSSLQGVPKKLKGMPANNKLNGE